MKENWYCYICGKKFSKDYYLCSMNPSTDRVFLICSNKCLNRVSQKDHIIAKVKEIR